MNRGSPPTKEATRLGLNPDRDAKTEKVDGSKISNSDTRSNSDCCCELIEHQGKVSLFRLLNGRRSSYQVAFGNERWNFSLEFSARSKFDRIASRIGGAQQ